MRSTAGRATWPDGSIELNPALREVSAAEVERTLLHELAHLVAFERAGRRRIKPHGPEWRRACADLGIAGESASHRLELPSRRMRRKWLYVCPNCFEQYERVRRMHRHSACWACCRSFAAGQYDERFRFVEKRLNSG
jgi:predicted SprT family Zn-dependent metalloprotease